MNKSIKIKPTESIGSVQIVKLSHDGRGIASVNQKKLFVEGALPDEIVNYRLTKKRSHYLEGVATEVSIASPARNKPKCEHFGICGGCNLQHMLPNLQIELKQQTLLEQLKHFGNVSPANIIPPLQSNFFGYRRKARLGVKFVIKKNKLLVGFREKAKPYLAELNQCETLHESVGKKLRIIADCISDLSCFQQVPQVEVAIGDLEGALIFRHLSPFSEEDKNKLIAFGQLQNFHIYCQPNPPEPLQKLWPNDTQERLTYSLPDEQLTFLFHPLDFTQINLAMNRKMVAQAMSLLQVNATDHVLDLFCGIGNFSLPLAKRAAHVTGIEGSSEMVERAYENAKHNKIDNVSFYASNLMAVDQETNWMKQKYHKILLDPPRAGAQEIIQLFAQFEAAQILYVSCNPATFARDAGILVNQLGYQLKTLGLIDMFPNTQHVEAMALFER